MAGKNNFLKETEALRDLRTLEEIEKNPNLSQRELAHSLGTALGIANACIHTLGRKGMIKIRGTNNRSVTYHLTKKGLLHKSMLAMEWTKNTIDFYRQARHRVVLKLADLAKKGIKTIILYGDNELSEIVLIVASEAKIKIVGIIRNDDTYARNDIFGIPVGDITLLRKIEADAVAICSELSERELEELDSRLAVGKNKVRLFHLYRD